jgi:hypothetical protein
MFKVNIDMVGFLALGSVAGRLAAAGAGGGEGVATVSF